MPSDLNRDTLKELLAVRQRPCLSLYQPTHRSFPEREQTPFVSNNWYVSWRTP